MMNADTSPMKNRIAVVLLVVAPLMFCANYAPAQENSEGARKVVTKVLPQIPSLARSLHLQGNVRADVLVAANGKVKSVEVKGGHPLLVQAAQSALSQWTWEPVAHETHESVELRFTP
jgi:outer membrane biosynthesis protein TonB